SALPDGQITKMPSSVVARTERSELRDFRRAGGVPDCAIGRRFAPPRWLHPGYGRQFRNFRNNACGPTQISCICPPSRSKQGRLAIVTDAGRDAVDAAALLTNSA